MNTLTSTPVGLVLTVLLLVLSAFCAVIAEQRMFSRRARLVIYTATFVFLLAWDEVFFAWVLTSSPDVQTVPVGLRLYMGQHATRYDLMMAAAVVSVIPVMLTFLASQRWFVKGLAAGAVKG